MLPNVVDVSFITGGRIQGKVTSWQTLNGVEHLAGRSPTDDLLVFRWSPQHDWQVDNVTQATGQKIASDLTSWQSAIVLWPLPPGQQQNLAGRSPTGDLLVFWREPQHYWRAVNVTQVTGQKIAGDLTSWRSGDFEFLAGRSPTGDLLVFRRESQYVWLAVNLTQITGEKIAGNLTRWRSGDFEFLAGRNPTGDLLVFWRSPQRDWQVLNVTNLWGQKIAGDLTSWRSGNTDFLAGRSPTGDLLVFSPLHLWQAISASGIAGGSVTGDPVVYQIRDDDGDAEMLAVRGTNDALLFYWRKPVLDWQVADITQISGRRIHSDPEAWTTPSGVEHLAAEGDAQSLLVFSFDSEVRREGICTERWASVGPRNITCVIRALAAHPSDPNVLCAGADFGGVWRTVNGGATWTATMNDEINPCVSALALCRAQPDVVYAGMSPGRVGSEGGTDVTLYRSADGGASWASRTKVSSTFCRALAAHPSNPEILYFGGNNGLHKTIDGGVSWTDVLSGDIDDVKLDIDAPDTLYASVKGLGIRKSTTGGTTWTPKGAGVSFTVLDNDGNQQNAALDGQFRTLLAIGEDRRSGKHGTQFLVAKMQGTILTSTNGGDQWRVLPGADHGYDRQNWWTSCVAVCPRDQDFIVAGGGRMHFTLDASAGNPTWKTLPDDLHEDQQAIAFIPSNPNSFYFANDGYIGKAHGRGASSAKISDGLVASQCWNVAVSQTTTLVVGCSTYHTGTVRTGRTLPVQWEAIDGPEGGLFEIDPTNDATMFGCPWGQTQLRRSRTGGNSWESFVVATEDGTVTYIQTLAMRPDDPRRIYASGKFGRVHFSTDGGDQWAVVLSASGSPLLPNASMEPGDGKFIFAYASPNGATLYLGTNKGHLWRTTSGATAASGWVELNTPYPSYPGRISAIAVAPNDPNRIFVGFVGNEKITGSRSVWQGTQQPAGTFQWTEISGAAKRLLPRVPVNGLVVDPSNPAHIFAATNVGVYATVDLGTSWRPFMEGLPRMRIVDIQLRVRSRMLYVAAFGRGIFRRRI